MCFFNDQTQYYNYTIAENSDFMNKTRDFGSKIASTVCTRRNPSSVVTDESMERVKPTKRTTALFKWMPFARKLDLLVQQTIALYRD